MFFESLWPKYDSKICVILRNIERHTVLMNSEVTLAHITEAYAARTRMFGEYERAIDFQHRQDFESAKVSLSPHLYDNDLERLQRGCCPESGRWLEKEMAFSCWLDPRNKSARLIWFQGIPGAGELAL